MVQRKYAIIVTISCVVALSLVAYLISDAENPCLELYYYSKYYDCVANNKDILKKIDTDEDKVSDADDICPERVGDLDYYGCDIIEKATYQGVTYYTHYYKDRIKGNLQSWFYPPFNWSANACDPNFINVCLGRTTYCHGWGEMDFLAMIKVINPEKLYRERGGCG